MRKMMLLLGTILMGPMTLIGMQPDQICTVIKYDDQYLVLEKGWSRPGDKLFISNRDESGLHWYKLDGRDSSEVHIVKDTITAVSPILSLIDASPEEALQEAYRLWKSGQKEQRIKHYGQTYNAWLTNGYVKTKKILIYYDPISKEVIGESLDLNSARFPWENLLLFLVLFLFGLKIRNVFNNYGVVSTLLVFLIYLLVSFLFLGYLIIRFSQLSLISQTSQIILISQVSQIILVVSAVTMILIDITDKHWRRSLMYKSIKRRAREGLIAITAMSVVFGATLWIATSHWQFLALVLVAGQTAYFFPGLRGKFDPLKKFIMNPLK